MKLKKFEISALCIAAAAIVFTVGFFIGRGGRSGDIIIEKAAGVTAPAEYAGEIDADISENDAKTADGEIININSATAAQLEALPGIGKTLAERIIEYRDSNGNFEKTEDLTKVEGIGGKKFEAIKELVAVK